MAKAKLKPVIGAYRKAAPPEPEPLWYPTANDLKLPEVPWDAREDVRDALSFLGKIPIQAMDGSWLIAQAITELADSPRVAYCEGLMSAVGRIRITPGAWNLVDGHIVCLYTEVKNRENARAWLYEPLNTYSLADIYAARRAGYPTCSAHEFWQTVVGTPKCNILETVFNDPLQRMAARKGAKYIRLDW
jgi:hypothetical protein